MSAERVREAVSWPGSVQRLRVTWPGHWITWLSQAPRWPHTAPWYWHLIMAGDCDLWWWYVAILSHAPLIILLCSVSSVSAACDLLSCREKASSPPPPRPGQCCGCLARPGRPQWAQAEQALGPLCAATECILVSERAGSSAQRERERERADWAGLRCVSGRVSQAAQFSLAWCAGHTGPRWQVSLCLNMATPLTGEWAECSVTQLGSTAQVSLSHIPQASDSGQVTQDQSHAACSAPATRGNRGQTARHSLAHCSTHPCHAQWWRAWRAPGAQGWGAQAQPPPPRAPPWRPPAWAGADLTSTTEAPSAGAGRTARPMVMGCALVPRAKASTAGPGITASRCLECTPGPGMRAWPCEEKYFDWLIGDNDWKVNTEQILAQGERAQVSEANLSNKASETMTVT